MSEFLHRQISILRKAIEDYRAGLLHLNALIKRVEEISDAIGIQEWKDALFPIVLEMEQVNAANLNTNTNLSDANKKIISKALQDIEALVGKSIRP
ncbi:hypothetical protein MGMO_15c00490 [Methyloglobulus morosus KoM1]|uniref:Uncharacterized protein n=2 Tax=Methyloglobulus TaxID=1410680 RepID=V5CA04_9GAMM|nr:hypothetical protein MGMO_15c00490 [Methyloglobulus morosus KoM1]